MSSSERPSLSRRARSSPTGVALVAIAALALALRLFRLGERVAHWDEARVGYWILRYGETGIWEYRAIVHGPFFPQVNRILFDLFGASDFTARLPVAVVAGLLPLAAWLYRDHLADSEMVALALLLSFNPVLLYYSRFMRNDVVLAAFMLFTLGFLLRAHATRKPRYLFAATATLALAFTTKENVLIYLLTWIGAGALLLDHRLFLARNENRGWTGVLAERARRWGRGFARWGPYLGVAAVEFLVIVVYFYAPRARGVERPGLEEALSDPAAFAAVFDAATFGAWSEFVGTWGNGSHQDHAYLPYFEHFVDVLAQGALPLVVLAVVGFVAVRYADDRPRDLVSFAFYWGAVSVLGYPLATDIQAPWATVHAIAPLAIPAAVGAAMLYRWGRDAYERGDLVAVLSGTLVVLLVVWGVAAPAVSATYVHPEDRTLTGPFGDRTENRLVQYGQPAEGIRSTLETMRAVAKANEEGTDVLYYGYVDGDGNEVFYVMNESSNDQPPAAGGWYNRLPLPWYTELADAEVDSTDRPSDFAERRPPVVITRTARTDRIEEHLGNYRRFDHELTIWGSETTVYIREDALRRVEGSA